MPINIAQARSLKEYQRRISKAIDFINENLDGEILPEQVAATAQFSKFHFYRLFKAMTDESVLGFVRRLRLERAATKLKYDLATSITNIALDASFASTQSFAKAFQKNFNCSPSEYRRRKHGHLNSNLDHPNRTQGAASLVSLEQNTSLTLYKNKTMKNLNINVKTLDQKHVAYIRRFGPYGFEITPYWERLMQWAVPRGLSNIAENGKTREAARIGAYWDNPEITPAEKCRTDVCIEVPQGFKASNEVVTQTLAGG